MSSSNSSVKARRRKLNFVADDGARDYKLVGHDTVPVPDWALAAALGFLGKHAPAIRWERGGRIAGLPYFFGTEAGGWSRGYVVRPVDYGMRVLTRDVQETCAALGYVHGLDYVDLVTVEKQGSVAVYRNVFRAA